MEVILNNEIGAFAKLKAEARGIKMRLAADGPAANADRAVSDAHAAESGFAALLRFVVNFTIRIREIKDVMDDGSGRRFHDDGGEPFIFGESKRDGDVAVNIGPVSR